jgi:hypothetical protein
MGARRVLTRKCLVNSAANIERVAVGYGDVAEARCRPQRFSSTARRLEKPA